MGVTYVPREKKRNGHAKFVFPKKPTIKVEQIDGYWDCTITNPSWCGNEYRQGAIRHTKEEIRQYVLWQTKVLEQRGIILPKIYV